MLSLAWSIVAYHKALRMSRDDSKNINHVGLAFRFLWRLFEVSPRIIILAMFMSAYTVSAHTSGCPSGLADMVTVLFLHTLSPVLLGSICRSPLSTDVRVAAVPAD